MIAAIEVNGEVYKVDIYHNEWEWCVVEENYDGPEDHYRAASGKTVAEAIEALKEKLTELKNL